LFQEDVTSDTFSNIWPLTYVAGIFLVTGAVWSKTSFGVTLLLITDG